MEAAAPTPEPTAEQALVESATPESTAPETTQVETSNLLPDTTPDVGTAPVEEPWFNSLDEEFRNDPNITKFPTMNEAAKTLIHQAGMMGKKGIIKPGEESTPEEWNEYYNAIGRPTESSMYKYNPIEGAPEVSAEDLAPFQEFAHSKGYTQEQFQSAIEFQYELTQQAQQTLEGERVMEAQQTQDTLLQELGEIGYEQFIADASRAANDLGIYDILVDNGLGGNLDVMRALNKASKSLGSSKLVGDHKVDNGSFSDQIAKLKSNPAYKDKLHPDYNSIQDQIDKLYARYYS